MISVKIYTLFFCFTLSVFTINSIYAQSCLGTWEKHRPASDPCVTGQYIGQPFNPFPCPINPSYTALQTNTFTFASPVSTFSIDFSGFDGAVGCPRMEIKINGVFYPLSNANISDVAPSPTCTGFFSTIAVTNDGYITTTNILYSQGRITLTNVNASSVTVSTNDGNGTVFSDPLNCTTIVPINLIFFSGSPIYNCKSAIRWKSSIEQNVKNMEVLRSTNGVIFNKVGVVSPRGDNSSYSIETDNKEDAFFRLRINDLDGSYTYSEIVNVKANCTNQNISVYPNPSSYFIEITGLQKNDKIFIQNALGQTILQYTSKQNVNNKINVKGLAPGMYFVHIINEKGVKTTLKFLKY